MALEKTILWLSIKSIDEKIAFIQRLLFNITVMNRAMWSDDQTTDKTKVESLKWSNELSHRVWNILYELKRGKDDNSENKLVSTFAFCAKQSNELAKHLGATIKMTVERCEQ